MAGQKLHLFFLCFFCLALPDTRLYFKEARFSVYSLTNFKENVVAAVSALCWRELMACQDISELYNLCMAAMQISPISVFAL